jgi:hypothetical protein
VFEAWKTICCFNDWDGEDLIDEETLYVESVSYDEETLTDIVVLRYGEWMRAEMELFRDNLALQENSDNFLIWKLSYRRWERYHVGIISNSRRDKILHNNAYISLLIACKAWLLLEKGLGASGENKSGRKRKYFEFDGRTNTGFEVAVAAKSKSPLEVPMIIQRLGKFTYYIQDYLTL